MPGVVRELEVHRRAVVRGWREASPLRLVSVLKFIDIYIEEYIQYDAELPNVTSNM